MTNLRFGWSFFRKTCFLVSCAFNSFVRPSTHQCTTPNREMELCLCSNFRFQLFFFPIELRVWFLGFSVYSASHLLLCYSITCRYLDIKTISSGLLSRSAAPFQKSKLHWLSLPLTQLLTYMSRDLKLISLAIARFTRVPFCSLCHCYFYTKTNIHEYFSLFIIFYSSLPTGLFVFRNTLYQCTIIWPSFRNANRNYYYN